MGGQGRQIGGLALVLMGVFGVCLVCGLPMWREASFVGANIGTPQSVWDGLWLHCLLQATGQMQCESHTTSITLTSDIQAGRALTLISILAGLLGYILTLLGGGAADCSGAPSDPLKPSTTSSSRKKVCLLGGALCVLAGILCLVAVSWSAAATVSIYNEGHVTAALKREVGSSIYIGWASSVLLLLGGALICLVCGERERTPPPFYSYPQVHEHTSLVKAQSGLFNQPQETQLGSEQGTFGRKIPQTDQKDQIRGTVYSWE
ncbi:hypothetical protein VZT92_006284 [Zoarces viviparus]|uniref:Claudin n=1 Tax=Zoarces viviparus TaxID=48416 RepID=A0AAW1FPB0_ZOAVI